MLIIDYFVVALNFILSVALYKGQIYQNKFNLQGNVKNTPQCQCRNIPYIERSKFFNSDQLNVKYFSFSRAWYFLLSCKKYIELTQEEIHETGKRIYEGNQSIQETNFTRH